MSCGMKLHNLCFTTIRFVGLQIACIISYFVYVFPCIFHLFVYSLCCRICVTHYCPTRSHKTIIDARYFCCFLQSNQIHNKFCLQTISTVKQSNSERENEKKNEEKKMPRAIARNELKTAMQAEQTRMRNETEKFRLFTFNLNRMERATWNVYANYSIIILSLSMLCCVFVFVATRHRVRNGRVRAFYLSSFFFVAFMCSIVIVAE